MNFLPTRRPKLAASAVPVVAPQLLSIRVFLVGVCCLVALIFAIYSPALEFQFVLDDHRFVADPRIQFSGHIWDYFANYVWAQFEGGPPSFYRPLFILWLRINFVLSAMSPWGWHLLSILKHAAVAVLLAVLVWKLLRDRVAALLAATLFALHPAHTESVAWVTVPDPLMAAGVLGALLLFLKYAADSGGPEEKKSRRAGRVQKLPQPRPLWIVLSAGIYFAALLAKETAIVLPVMIFVLVLIMPRGEKPEIGFPRRSMQALGLTLPFLGVTVFYLLMRFNALGGKFGAVTQNLPWSTVLRSWPATLCFYLKVLLWPARSRAFADPTLQETFTLRGVLLPAFGMGCALAILVAGLFWAWAKARRDLSQPDATDVGLALMIGTLLLVLPIFLTLDLKALNPGDFLHGRYTYLPSAGLMLLLATGWHLAGEMRLPLVFASGLLAVLFAALAFSQEGQWKDDLTVFTVAHQLAPHNAPVTQNLANAHVQLALQQADNGQCDDAMPVFEQVRQEYPQNWYAWAGLAICYVQANNLSQAEEALHRAAEISHNPRVMQQWQDLRANMGLPLLPAK